MTKIRILVAKPGLDGHDRGAKIVAAGLRDAGMEIIYTGLHQTADSIVESAIQEDVDVIGLSMLSGAHMTFFPKVRRMLDEKGASDIVLIGGGIIPVDDRESLISEGHAAALFPPGTEIDQIVSFINENIRK